MIKKKQQNFIEVTPLKILVCLDLSRFKQRQKELFSVRSPHISLVNPSRSGVVMELISHPRGRHNIFLHISLLKPWTGIVKYGSTEDEGGVEWTVIN